VESTPTKTDEESFELKSLRQKYALACDQLKDATTTNSHLMMEIEQKNTILAKLRNIEKDLAQHRKENEKLHVETQQKDQTINEQAENLVELKREHRKLQENIKKASALQFSLESEISDLRHSPQNSGEQSRKKINLLQSELENAEELIVEQEKRINELEWEKKKH